jgi:hypothetical protein
MMGVILIIIGSVLGSFLLLVFFFIVGTYLLDRHDDG